MIRKKINKLVVILLLTINGWALAVLMNTSKSYAQDDAEIQMCTYSPSTIRFYITNKSGHSITFVGRGINDDTRQPETKEFTIPFTPKEQGLTRFHFRYKVFTGQCGRSGQQPTIVLNGRNFVVRQNGEYQLRGIPGKEQLDPL